MRWLPLLLLLTSPAVAAPPNEALKSIMAVSKEGTDNAAVAAAWKEVVAGGVDNLFPTLDAFAEAGPNAANWLRSAVSAIAENQKKAKKPLPAAELKTFVTTKTHHPAARRIAYELLLSESPTEATAVVVTLIDDADQDLRYEAIAERLNQAKAKSPDALLAAQNELLVYVRNQTQAEQIAEALGKAGKPVNLTKFFNYVTEWHIIGPFDNTDGVGFAQAFPPERMIDLTAEYPGKDKAVKWQYAQSDAKSGTIDFNKEFGKVKFAVAYAYAEIESPKAMPIDLRASGPSAVQIVLNGKQVFSRDVYHNNGGMDCYLGKGMLNAGSNKLLVKICQNDQKQPWAQTWNFELRLCDSTGGKVDLQQTIQRPGTTQPALIPLGDLKPADKDAPKEKK